MPVSTVSASHARSPTPDDRPIKRAKVEEVERCQVEQEMALPIEFVKTYEHELEYRNQLVLAPMVRTGSLPMRLLSLYYGAGLVWSPEVVDKAIIGSERIVNPETGVITYTKGQGPIFSTHPLEKPYLIFQIGSSDPELALKAAQTVQQDVAGIDLNCGCPKSFSTHSGMGAALLSTPDLLLEILRKLLDNVPLPISCKIRLLPTQPDTLTLVARILRTGIRNLTVHCRTRDMRPRERALWERLGEIVTLGQRRNVPVICNGDGDGWANWNTIRDQTGADSVMIARAAERNPSVFLPSGPRCNVTEVVPKLLKISQYTNNPWGNTKFLLSQFRPSSAPISTLSKKQKKDAQEAVNRSKSLEEVASQLGVELSGGKELLKEIEAKLAERPSSDAFQQRARVVEEGRVVDEVSESTAQGQVDGFEVGVGQAQAELGR